MDKLLSSWTDTIDSLKRQAVYSTHLPILLFSLFTDFFFFFFQQSLFTELGNSEMEICLFQKPKRNGNRPNIYITKRFKTKRKFN